ncbi:MAG: penicillin-binding protein activator [Desulfurococcales archaeon]|nr:penicillin-binding protein activator [Desulfurococcales archaeon]
MRYTALAALALVAVLALSLAASFTQVAQAQQTITIGALLPLTGDLQSYGVRAKAAVEVAVDDMNKYLEQQNAWFRLELVVADTQTKPDVAVQQFNSLVAQGIKFIVGPMTSAEVKKLKELADQNNVLLISPSSTAIELAIPGDNVFRFCPADDVQSKAIGALARDLGIKAVVIINRADTWGEGLAKATKSVLESLGIEVKNVYSYNPESPNFSAIASSAANDVKALVSEYGYDKVAVIAIGFKEVVQLFKQAANYKELREVAWFGSDGTANLSEFIKDPVAAEFSMETLFINPIFSPAATETQLRVKDEVKAKIGEEPDAYSYAAYDAVVALTLALLKVGPKGSPDELVNAVKQVLPEITTSDEFAGMAATGKFPLNDAGDRATADYDWWIIYKVGGKPEWVKVGVYKGVEDKNEWTALPDGKTFPDLFSAKFAAMKEEKPAEATPEKPKEETPAPAETETEAPPAEKPAETMTTPEEGGISTTAIVAAIIIIVVVAAAAFYFLRMRGS